MIMAALVSPGAAAPENVLAWAVIAGGFLQMAVLIPGVVKAGFFPKFTTHWNSPDVIRVAKAIAPSMFGMSIMQVTAIVNMHFTSTLPSGSQSYLYFADRILELPLSMFVVSVGSALLPTLAKYWAEDNKEAMSDTINHYIRLILFVALPAAIGMFCLAQPIVSVLFLGKEFKYNDALATAQVIQVYSFTVIIAAGVRILAQGFYAIQNTWFPAVAGAVALCSHIIFAYTLTNAFGLNGLAAASLCSATVNMLMLATAYNSWVGSLKLKSLIGSFIKFSICGAVMAAVLMLHGYLSAFLGARFFMRALALFIMIGAGATVYMIMAHILKIPEYRETAATFGGKIKRKLKRA
jgi:putative peptidoglycan lipid II flippase